MIPSRLRKRILLALVLLALAAILDHAGLFGYRGDDYQRFDQQAVAVSVIDGDTVRLVNPSDVRVRLIGIDAPELHNSYGKPDHFAEESRRRLIELTRRSPMTLRLDSARTRDRYGRLLAYLYAPDNRNLNLEMVRDGAAYADRRFSHTFRRQFEQAESEAHRKKLGLWKDITDSQMPAWRRP